MKALNPGKWSTILSTAGDIFSGIGEGLKPEDEYKGTEKGLFNRKEEEAQALAQAEAEAKKKQTTMYIIIGAVAFVLLFGKKLMK